jgi:hypothetical protein
MSMAQKLNIIRIQISTAVLALYDVVSDHAVSGSAALAVGSTLSLDPSYQ